ncbi:RHS repeat domain-containing protein [Microbulbifer sp. VAAC004]|uniref:RHS repeat domain-containing protein n=1 Tax=unclassified Microbulbifer TaxID=2619833 RepID=UPI00403A3A53
MKVLNSIVSYNIRLRFVLNIIKNLFFGVLGVFVLVAAAHADPKYCSRSGTYYCGVKVDDPASHEDCRTDVKSAFIPGVNLHWREFDCSGWKGPSDWVYQYDIALSSTEESAGVYGKQLYWRTCELTDGTIKKIQSGVVYMYQCQTCEHPYSWDPVKNQCIKYCPPSRPVLNEETGLCESEGRQQCEITEGNPVVVATGEKVQHELPDYQSLGDFPLVFKRNYRSQRAIDANPIYNYQYFNVDATDLFTEITNSSSGWKKYYQPSGYVSGKSYFGWDQSEDPDGSQSYVPPEVGFKQWRHNYQYSLWISEDGATARLRNPNGEDLRFSKGGDLFVSSQLNGKNLTPIFTDSINTGWLYRPKRGVSQTYDLEGKLVRVEKTADIYHSLVYDDQGYLVKISHSLGEEIALSYNAKGQLSSIAPKDQKLKVNYSYDGSGNLNLVTFQELNSDDDGTTDYSRQYHYESSRHPYALTGITDERGIRYVTWVYDDMGRVTRNLLANDNGTYTFEYPSESKTSVTNPLGKQTDYLYSSSSGSKRLYGIIGQPSTNCVSATRSITYLSNGLPYKTTDWEGNETIYGYNSRGLENVRYEAFYDNAQRKTDTEWHPTEPWPVKITTESEIIEYEYDSNGNILSETRTPK